MPYTVHHTHLVLKRALTKLVLQTVHCQLYITHERCQI